MMALLTVEGIYRDGKVELAERPAGVVDSARVLVTFLPAPRGGENAKAEPSPEELARIEAKERLIARLKEGIPFGGSPYPKREELYDRVDRYDQKRDD